MQKTADDDFETYNRLVLQHQDEAFTLAAHLLGDDDRACEVVDETFRKAFESRRIPRHFFRLEVLRQVVTLCRGQVRKLAGPPRLAQLLAGPVDDEKIILALVDCLGLGYNETGVILGKNPAQIMKTLAQARYKIPGIK
jgi:DNA-directed RNA polymerase specialized sigma24 family protein